MALRGAVAEWLGRGLQSLVHQFDSGRRLFDKRTERGSPGQVTDGLHRTLFVEPAEIDLGRVGLCVSQDSLQRLSLARMCLQELDGERSAYRVDVRCLYPRSLREALNRVQQDARISVTGATLLT